jgi:hypothetical protein
MSNRARWILLVVIATFAALGAGAYTTYESFQSWTETRLRALRASTPGLAPERTPESRELAARLDAIDRWVRDNTTPGDPFGPPWLKAAEDVVDLPMRLDRMGAFFEQVDVLTSSEGCQEALERGVTLDMPTRRLMLARTRTNLLCARAWIDHRVGGDTAAAARRLGQALDLARLGDDGRAIGLLIDIANEGTVLSATQEILRDPSCDAKILRGQLDARLARMRDPERIRQSLILDFMAFREQVHGKGIVALVHELRYLEALDHAMALVDLPGAKVAPVIQSYEGSPNRYDAAWCAIMKNWHFARTHAELGRAALALAARSEESLPIDPYSNEPFAREATADGVRISSPAAIRSLGNPSQPRLLSWTLPR